MSTRTLFERTRTSSSQALSRVERVLSFLRDFYYYNAELVSFFIINLWLFIYFVYCSTNPFEVELEVQSNKQILLHALTKGDRTTEERINNATTDAEADALFRELVSDTSLDIGKLLTILSADNETMQIAATYEAWKNRSFAAYYLWMLVILAVYIIALSHVWYYSYFTHNTFFLFVLMSANIFAILVMRDPFGDNDRRLVPVLESLKEDNPHVRYLKVSGRVLIDHSIQSNFESRAVDVVSRISSVLENPDISDSSKELQVIALLSRNTASAPLETRREVINTTISEINSTWYYNSLWYTAVANYVYRVYQLINGLAPHITFYNKMTI